MKVQRVTDKFSKFYLSHSGYFREYFMGWGMVSGLTLKLDFNEFEQTI